MTKREYHIGKAALIRAASSGLISSGIVMMFLSIFFLVQLPVMSVDIYEAAIPLLVSFLFIGIVLLILGIALWKQVEVKEPENAVFV